MINKNNIEKIHSKLLKCVDVEDVTKKVYGNYCFSFNRTHYACNSPADISGHIQHEGLSSKSNIPAIQDAFGVSRETAHRLYHGHDIKGVGGAAGALAFLIREGETNFMAIRFSPPPDTALD